MSEDVKNKIWQKIAEGSLVVVFMGIVSYYLYNDNLRHQERLETRLEKVEEQVENCMRENLEILRNEVKRGIEVIERNNRALKKYFDE